MTKARLWACWRCNWLNNWFDKNCQCCSQTMRVALEKIEANSRLDGGNPSQDGKIASEALGVHG